LPSAPVSCSCSSMSSRTPCPSRWVVRSAEWCKRAPCQSITLHPHHSIPPPPTHTSPLSPGHKQASTQPTLPLLNVLPLLLASVRTGAVLPDGRVQLWRPRHRRPRPPHPHVAAVGVLLRGGAGRGLHLLSQRRLQGSCGWAP
jgi:hypothetical protein